MCGILGIAFRGPGSLDLTPFLVENNKRGRDSWGLYTSSLILSNRGEEYSPAAIGHGMKQTTGFNADDHSLMMSAGRLIGNMRAEPTTEFVKDKRIDDVQPYRVGRWTIVHNGTIANDKEIIEKYIKDYPVLFAPPTRIDSWVIAALLEHFSRQNMHPEGAFQAMLNEIVGSYAILAMHDDFDSIYYAVNYRPLYLIRQDGFRAMSSVPPMIMRGSDPNEYVEKTFPAELVTPYSWGSFSPWHNLQLGTLYKENQYWNKVLVVHSGGLDSTVAAAELKYQGYDVTLLHFCYGARAEGPETQAVRRVARALDVPMVFLNTDIFKVIGGSRLTNTKKDVEFAEGEAGAEYAHEWVPARNLIMASVALGYAESKGFGAIALGANLEEAGAYPDNEPEFLDSFRRLIPFAVGDGKRIQVLTPVGNLMKHEIVARGLKINAPMHLSWSCYDAHQEKGEYRHCGHCGPCFMRKTAFEINGKTDPVFNSFDESMKQLDSDFEAAYAVLPKTKGPQVYGREQIAHAQMEDALNEEEQCKLKSEDYESMFPSLDA